MCEFDFKEFTNSQLNNESQANNEVYCDKKIDNKNLKFQVQK